MLQIVINNILSSWIPYISNIWIINNRYNNWVSINKNEFFFHINIVWVLYNFMYDGISSDQANLGSRTNLRLPLIKTSIYIYACTYLNTAYGGREVSLIGLYAHKQVSWGCQCLAALTSLGLKLSWRMFGWLGLRRLVKNMAISDTQGFCLPAWNVFSL